MPHREMKKSLGRFLAQSVSPDGRILRTYHDEEVKAAHRLIGNRRHHGKVLIDTQPPKARVPE